MELKKCKSCGRTFGSKVDENFINLLLRDPEFTDYCDHGCAAVVRKYLDEVQKKNAERILAYLDSGEVKTTLIGRAFDLSQEQSKEAFADFISNFMVQVETWELKKSQK